MKVFFFTTTAVYLNLYIDLYVQSLKAENCPSFLNNFVSEKKNKGLEFLFIYLQPDVVELRYFKPKEK